MVDVIKQKKGLMIWCSIGVAVAALGIVFIKSFFVTVLPLKSWVICTSARFGENHCWIRNFGAKQPTRVRRGNCHLFDCSLSFSSIQQAASSIAGSLSCDHYVIAAAGI
jgi:hypothetical protein